MSNASSAKGNPASKRMTNPNYKAKRARNANKQKCKGLGCNNDAIGVVGRDPYDHVSWSPIVTPRPYWFERILIRLGHRSRCCAAKVLPVHPWYWPYFGRCSQCRNLI